MAELDNPPRANTGSPPSRNSLASVLGAAVMRRISLPKFLSVSGSASSITIDQIRLNNTEIDRVDVADVITSLDTGAISMENTTAIVSLSLRFNYGIHIPLPWPFSDINIDDSFSLGGITFPFDVGGVTIAELNNVNMEIPSATLEDIRAAIEPVNNLNLGGAEFDGLELENTVLPSAGFGLSGMSLGAFTLTELTVPSITSASLSVNGFSLENALQLPSLSIDNIHLPTASAPQVSTVSPVIIPNVTADTQEIPLTGGILTTSIDITPTLSIVIGSMNIDNVSADTTIGRVDLHGVQSTVQVSGIAANGLELTNVELESVATTA